MFSSAPSPDRSFTLNTTAAAGDLALVESNEIGRTFTASTSVEAAGDGTSDSVANVTNSSAAGESLPVSHEVQFNPITVTACGFSTALCANMRETTLCFSKLRARRTFQLETIDKKVSLNPEMNEKATRRRFSQEYKERMVSESQQCQRPGELGALLRREGLRSTTLNRWRRQPQENSLNSKKASSKETPAQENKQLKREISRWQNLHDSRNCIEK